MGVRIRYELTGRGTDWRPVTCEHCRAEFAYSVKAETSKSFMEVPTHEDQVQLTAEARRDAARRPVVAHRCPSCDQLQSSMVLDAQHFALGNYYGGILVATVVGVIVSAFIGIVWVVVVLGCAVAAFFVVGSRAKRVPIAIAAQRSPVGMSRAEYEALRIASGRFPPPELHWSSATVGLTEARGPQPAIEGMA